MKTAEEALKRLETPVFVSHKGAIRTDNTTEVYRCALSEAAFILGYNTAIEAMRAESEPVGYVSRFTFNQLKNKRSLIGVEISNTPYHMHSESIYTTPQPLRELSGEEIEELWKASWEPEDAGIKWSVVERFAKLVREAK